MSQSISNMQQVWLSNTNTYNAIAMTVSTLGYGTSSNSSMFKINVDGNTKVRVDANGGLALGTSSTNGRGLTLNNPSNYFGINFHVSPLIFQKTQ